MNSKAASPKQNNNTAEEQNNGPVKNPATATNEDKRHGELYVATGFKKVGKTYKTRHELMDIAKREPVVIFDVTEEYGPGNPDFPEVPTIDFDIDSPSKEKAAKYIIGLRKPGLYRIRPLKKNGQSMNIEEKSKTAYILLEFLRNGTIVLEDLNNYMLGAKSIDMIAQITTNRHRGQDIIIQLQSATVIDTRLWQNIDVLRMHKQAQPMKAIRYDNNCPNIEMLEIVEAIIDDQYMNHKNRRVCIYTRPNEHKILNMPENIFRKGCADYLKKNPHFMQGMMKHVDDEGNKKYKNQVEAIEAWTNERMRYIEE